MFVPLALTACATLPTAAPVRGDGFARLGEATRVGTLVVTPLRVVEDSRCPINARCIWAGRAIVHTRIESGGRSETTDIELGRPYITHDRGLQLVSIEPGKLAGAQPDPPPPTVFGYESGH